MAERELKLSHPPTKMATLQSHGPTITHWVQSWDNTQPNAHRFLTGILEEERAKALRLQRLSERIGLPIYETQEFILPADEKSYVAACDEITASGFWELALRFSTLGKTDVLFRGLGANKTAAIAAAKSQRCKSFIAAVTPYREPERSGTLWMKDGSAVLEVVFGPHFWLTQSRPDHVELLRCEFVFPHKSVRYSMADTQHRRLLYGIFRDVIHIVLDTTLREASVFPRSVYCEFHWHAVLGYRFIECSGASVWTG